MNLLQRFLTMVNYN